MTKDKKAKAAARGIQAATGRSYTAALRAVLDGSGADTSRPSIRQLLTSSIHDVCANLNGEPVEHPGDTSSSGQWMDIEIQHGLSEVSVYEIQVIDDTIDVQVAEEYEGGTLACTASCEAELFVDGLVGKFKAISLEANNQAEIIDPDFNDHFAQVVVSLHIEAHFVAIVMPDSESVEDIRFEGATEIPR